jgi:hypothetical protein
MEDSRLLFKQIFDHQMLLASWFLLLGELEIEVYSQNHHILQQLKEAISSIIQTEKCLD